jgi:phospholipase C
MKGQVTGQRGTGVPSASLSRTVAVLAATVLLAIVFVPGPAGATTTATTGPERVSGGKTGTYIVPAGIHKIRHVIVIMQENRSFDSYFGTFPGADGIPMASGAPTVCVPDPATGACVAPYHNDADIDGGGPHGEANAIGDIDDGTMDGFIAQQQGASKTCKTPNDPACTPADVQTPDVMGYEDQREIPNYWTYAKDFVLDDHMFEPVKSWSLPDHLYMVSAWSAKCANTSPQSCVNNIVGPYGVAQFNHMVAEAMATGIQTVDLAWTDITWLLYAKHVSWAYYVQTGTQPDCDNDSAETCAPVKQSYRTPGIWNPLPLFGDVKQDNQLGNVQPLDNYFAAAKRGTLPAVTWIAPSNEDSEHPPSSIHQGQAYVTALINAAMKSKDWSSTAIFLSWDDWGGFYDNVVPPVIDQNGYGLRVPSIVISPYAKRGYVDHQTLSSDAYLKFIEDDYRGGGRLTPATDKRPDPRPDVREDEPQLGNLVNDFDFSQKPRPPVLLATNPPTDSPSIPALFTGMGRCFGCTTVPGPAATTSG